MSYSMLKTRDFNPWMAFILITATTFVIYSNIYHSVFVFDSVRQIEIKTEIRDLPHYFSFDQMLKPRAIVDFTFALNYNIGKLNVFGYHLSNVLIHIINGCLVYLLSLMVFQLSNRFPPYSGTKNPEYSDRLIHSMALFSSLIFVAHPIQTQAVTYTVQRYTSMAALFYMASILFYLKARINATRSLFFVSRGGKNALGMENTFSRRKISIKISMLYTLSIFFGMLSFLSKQNTATLPVVLLLVEYVFIDRSWQGWKKKIPWFGIFFVLWLLFVLYISGMFRGGVEGKGLLEDVSDIMMETETVSRWRYLCSQFNVLVVYMRLLFLPVKQNLDHFYPFKTGFFDGLTPLAFMFHIVVMGYGLWIIRRRPVVTFSIFFFFITLSVESSIIPIRDAMFEHRLYLPMFGFGLLVAYCLLAFLRDKKILAGTLPLLVVLSIGTSSYMRNRIWENNITLWSDVVAKAPHNYRGHINLGAALNGQGRSGEAITHYKEALRIKPDNIEALNNLAIALSGIGHREEATRYFTELVKTHPEDASAHYNFGMHLFEQGNMEDAGAHFFRAIELKPDYAEAYNIMGIVLAKQGDYRQAEIFFSKALKIKPDYDDPLENLEALRQISSKSNRTSK